jgi:hypothetical protein
MQAENKVDHESWQEFNREHGIEIEGYDLLSLTTVIINDI